MGKCRICGESAGFLRKVHHACEQQRRNEIEEQERLDAALRQAVLDAVRGDGDMPSVTVTIANEDGRLPFRLQRDEVRLSMNRPQRPPAARAGTPRGTTARGAGNDPLPFRLQKDERVLHAEGGVVYLQQTLAFQEGYWVIVPGSLVPVDSGMLGITNEHIYFHGSEHKFRIRLDGIVVVEAHEDIFVIMRDAAGAQSEAFQVADSDYCVALLDALHRRMIAGRTG